MKVQEIDYQTIEMMFNFHALISVQVKFKKLKIESAFNFQFSIFLGELKIE